MDIFAHQSTRRIRRAVGSKRLISSFLGLAAGQVGRGPPTDRGIGVQPKQLVLTLVVQCCTDIAVINPDAIRTLHQIHRIVVINQAHLQRAHVVQSQRGLVRKPGAARLLAFGVAANIGGAGLSWIVIDLALRQTARRLMFGLAVTQEETGF